MSSECCPAAWCLSSSQRHQLHPDALPCSCASHIISERCICTHRDRPPLPASPSLDTSSLSFPITTQMAMQWRK